MRAALARLVAALGWALLAGAASLGLALSLLAALAAAPFARPFVASRVISIVDDAIAGRLELEGVEVLASGGIDVRGLQVFDPDGHLVLSVGHARVFADITGLRTRAVGLTVELDAPSVLLEEEGGGGVSIARAFAPAHPSPPGQRRAEGPGWTLYVSRVTVRSGDVWWVDAAGDTRLQASALALDARGLFAPGRTRIDLRLRGDLDAPVAAPLALDVVGGITGDAVRVPVLRAELGGTAVSAVGEGDLRRRTGRLAVTRLGVAREVARALAPQTPAGDDLAATAYAESDGSVVTAAVRAEPVTAGRAGRADAAVAARLAEPSGALGFDVALDRVDPARLAALAPAGEVTLAAHGAVAGRSLRDLRGRVTAAVQRSRLRRGEVTKAELVARADHGSLEVSRATLAAPGLALDASLRWREGGEVTGRVAAEAADLRAALANVGALLARPTPPFSGHARVTATLGGTSAAPSAAATFEAPLLRRGGLTVAGVRLHATGTGPLRALAARFDGTAAAVRSSASDVAHAVALRGALAGDEGTVSATAALPGFKDPASLVARARLGPGRDSLLVSELTFAYPGTRWALAAPATVALAGPSVDRLALAAGAQRIAITGGLGRRGALDAAADVERLDLARLPAGFLPQENAIAGELSARVRAAGTVAHPEVSADLSLAGGAFRTLHGLAAVGKAAWQGAERRGTVSLSVSRDGGGAVDVLADLPLPLAGRPGERVRATVRASGVPVQELVAAAGGSAPATGLLALDATLEGTAGAPALRATAGLRDGTWEDLEDVGLSVALEDPGERVRVSVRLALEGREVATVDAETPLDVSELLVRPARALAALRSGRLEGSAAVTGLELATLSGRLGVPDGITGTVHATAAFTGSLAAPRANATVEVSGGAAAGYRGLGGRVALAAKDDGLTASGRVTLVDEEAVRFEASLGVPPERLGSRAAVGAAPLRAEVTVQRLALERAATQELPLTGSVTARITVAGTARAPEVTASAAGEGVLVEGRPLGAARLDGRYAARRATANAEVRPTAGGTLRATLALDADLGLGATGGPLAEAPAEVTAVAEALDLGFLPALAPSLVRTAAGKLALDLRAKGPLARLSPRGTLHVADARVAVSEYGEWTGVALDAAVTDDAVEVSRLEVHRGKGHLKGTASVRGLRSGKGQLVAHLGADAFAVARAGMDFATFDLAADATGTLSGRTLAMEVTVPRGVVRLPKKTPRELQTLERRKDIVVGKPP